MIHSTEYGTDIAREFCSWLILLYGIYWSERENTSSLFKLMYRNAELINQIIHSSI